MPAWTPGYQGFPRSLKTRLLAKYRVCQLCGERPSTEVDHIIPFAEGGKSTRDNARAVCSVCHDIKSKAERERGLARYRARRRGQARKPERHPGLLD